MVIQKYVGIINDIGNLKFLETIISPIIIFLALAFYTFAERCIHTLYVSSIQGIFPSVLPCDLFGNVSISV